MNDFFRYFAGGEFTITTTVMVMIIVFVFIIMMMYVPALTKRIFPKFGSVLLGGNAMKKKSLLSWIFLFARNK